MGPPPVMDASNGWTCSRLHVGSTRSRTTLPIGREKWLTVRHRHALSPAGMQNGILASRLFCGVWRHMLGSHVVTVDIPAPNVYGWIGHHDPLLHSRVRLRLRLVNKGWGVGEGGVGFLKSGTQVAVPVFEEYVDVRLW